MSKLDELIEKLCPNGVEYMQLDEVCSANIGEQLNKNKLSESGKYPVINGGINPSGYWDEFNAEKNTITISQGGASAGYVNFMKNEFWAGAHCYVIKLINDKINYRYLYHFLKSKQIILNQCQQGAGIPGLNRKALYSLCIAVPPLEVQCEIVHILDDFTLLSAELSAELKARQKQYEYYRDTLFEFDNSVKYYPLKELCVSIKDGMHNLPKDNSSIERYPILSAQNILNGKINFEAKRYVNQNIYEKENSRINLERDDVLLTIVATIGRTAIVEENNFLLQRSVCSLKTNKLILPKYLKYYLDTNKIQNYMRVNAHGSAQSGLYLNQVAEIMIPVPSTEKQEEIISFLESFEKICNDISQGLPAEIEARQKQYEYYRDKLLTFKELER